MSSKHISLIKEKAKLRINDPVKIVFKDETKNTTTLTIKRIGENELICYTGYTTKLILASKIENEEDEKVAEEMRVLTEEQKIERGFLVKIQISEIIDISNLK